MITKKINNHLIKYQFYIRSAKAQFLSALRNFYHYKLPAIGSIEMILILLVLVSLIVIFRTQITGIINSVFNKIHDQIDNL